MDVLFKRVQLKLSCIPLGGSCLARAISMNSLLWWSLAIVVSDLPNCSNFIFTSVSIYWYVRDGGLEVMAGLEVGVLGLDLTRIFE